MPRPEKNRIVENPPIASEFKPAGVGARNLAELRITLDEYEAVRLADGLGMTHEEASETMEISRSTFTRLIEKARKKLADFLLGGKLLTVGDGAVHFRRNILECQDCGHMFKIAFDQSLNSCPECDSTRLLSLAGGYGHGACCADRNKNRGGNHAKRR